MTTAWTAAHLARLDGASLPQAPVIGRPTPPAGAAELVLWDAWPVTDRDGRVAAIAGGELWLALSAPRVADPLARHAAARIRLLLLAGEAWRDLGDAMPADLTPGSREWSGSAVLEPNGELVLHFTAAGRRGEALPTFEQRLFETRARLRFEGARPYLTGWTPPVETVAADGHIYVVADQSDGEAGTIKAFRDPAWFRDPADGAEYLLFAASLAGSTSAFNGAVGVAARRSEGWLLMPPLVHADGVNNELERPHVVVTNGCYYLFWSTQRSVFAPGINAPTGLYGMVAPGFCGPWQPLNGSGLVLTNPSTAPDQAYSWLVLDDDRVASFLDRPPPGRFVGVPAPMLRICISGATTRITQ